MSEEVKIDVNIPSNAKDLAFMYLGTASKMELKYLEYLLTQFTKYKDQQIKDLTEKLESASERERLAFYWGQDSGYYEFSDYQNSKDYLQPKP